jgi:hypothetical protein
MIYRSEIGKSCFYDSPMNCVAAWLQPAIKQPLHVIHMPKVHPKAFHLPNLLSCHSGIPSLPTGIAPALGPMNETQAKIKPMPQSSRERLIALVVESTRRYVSIRWRRCRPSIRRTACGDQELFNHIRAHSRTTRLSPNRPLMRY